jgi:hypothetical protein
MYVVPFVPAVPPDVVPPAPGVMTIAPAQPARAGARTSRRRCRR